jgi:hypothetical protein
MSKSKHTKNKRKKKTNTTMHQSEHQTIKPWHRVGAIILIIALVVGMVVMYGFSYI